MICTATINGVLIEASGTPEECAKFIRAITPPVSYGSSAIKWVEKANENFQKKVCDPMARHIGNCGAEDCPIISACAHLNAYRSEYLNRSYCYDCKRYI